MSRIFHHYNDLEEYHAGMWKIVRGQKRKSYIAAAADLMRQPCEFKAAMIRVTNEWPKSCEANLTAESVNRIAWLGHAGNCIAVGSPEEATRVAWHTLDSYEQKIANKVAGEALELWLCKHRRATATPNLFDQVSA
jgi:hypothetical protein